MMIFRKKALFISVFIIISTCYVYTQVLNHDFVNFDDDEYITNNEVVKKGITLQSILWSFTDFHAANWHPLTWISHMVDCQFFGLDAGLHHLTNLIFHILNSLLLFIVFRKMTCKLWQSGFIAALFALHPLHVESVAWISERKDLLSTFWGLLTILNYSWYVQKKNILSLSGVVLFFSFGLMSKPMVVTLPFVLLLLDYWPLRRFPFQHKATAHHEHGGYSSVSWLLLEKTPLFFLSLLSCLITLLAQHDGQAIRSLYERPFSERVMNGIIAYASYIYKAVYPVNLCVLYPYRGTQQWWEVTGSAFLIVFISFFSIRALKSHPYFVVGWLWYLGTLIPVIGFIQVGIQSMADRYTYIPLTGLFIIIAWGVPDLLSGCRYKISIILISSLLLLFMFLAMTLQQVTYWKNGLTLSSRAVDVTTGNWLMETNLANMLVRDGKFTEGITHYIEALRIAPDNNVAYNNLMTVLKKVKGNQSVAKSMESALALYPDEYGLYFLVGKMYKDENKHEKATEYFKKSLYMNKKFIPSYYELSTIYMSINELEESMVILNQLLLLQPDSPVPYFRISRIYQLLGNDNKASEWYHRAVEKGYNQPVEQNIE